MSIFMMGIVKESMCVFKRSLPNRNERVSLLLKKTFLQYVNEKLKLQTQFFIQSIPTWTLCISIKSIDVLHCWHMFSMVFLTICKDRTHMFIHCIQDQLFFEICQYLCNAFDSIFTRKRKIHFEDAPFIFGHTSKIFQIQVKDVFPICFQCTKHPRPKV